jgi:hypothetical protein
MLISMLVFLALLFAVCMNLVFDKAINASVPAQIMVVSVVLRILFQFWLMRMGEVPGELDQR